jgi:response regulator of citrate/malate metabolism
MTKLKNTLIIEDDEDTRTLVKYWLIRKKITRHVDEFSTVEDAMAFINNESLSDNAWPGIVLLDLYLPDEKGFKFLENLSTNPVIRPYPKIFIITGSEKIQDIREASKYNIDAYIKKPLTQKKLDKSFSHVFNSKLAGQRIV